MKKLLIILIIFSSCVAKKTTVEFKEVIKRDSIFITKDRYITKQVNDTIVIDKPCDSLGNLKDFERVIVNDKVRVVIKTIQGKLQASVNIDSIVNIKVEEYKQNYKSKIETKEVYVTKYSTPLYMWILVVLEGLIIYLLIRF